MKDVMHGGRLDEVVARFGGTREEWIDLSTGINPQSYPVPEIPLETWTLLPDRDLVHAAETAARKAYQLQDHAGVSLAPGSQMHIQMLPSLFKPQPVAIVGFTYQEHGICWQRTGHTVYMTDGLDSAEATARIVIVVNPNNPDGRIFSKDDLTNLSRRLAAKGGLLVVDESFGELSPDNSVASTAGREGLFVMRSLGKFYGLAGVRFGVGLGAPPLITRLNERLGPWAVSGPALVTAIAALNDTRWRTKTLRKLGGQRAKLETVLEKNGLELLGGTDLFVLARHDDAQDIWHRLAESRILSRVFAGKPDWLRLGLPAGRAAWNRLDKALAGFEKPDRVDKAGFHR
jgi:cobalamin biosynthetic protein CobC